MKLSEQYSALLAAIKEKVSKLVEQIGKPAEDLHRDDFIDMREHNLTVDGYEVAYLNGDIFMDSDGMHYNYSILELELEELCEALDKIQETI